MERAELGKSVEFTVFPTALGKYTELWLQFCYKEATLAVRECSESSVEERSSAFF